VRPYRPLTDAHAPGQLEWQCYGADKAGDQELDPRIVQRARIFVDDIRQCRNDGEINVPLREGLITERDIAGEIGEVVTGRKPGRTSDDEITLFDSTGIALQESATVPLEYERALAAGVGVEKKMIRPEIEYADYEWSLRPGSQSPGEAIQGRPAGLLHFIFTATMTKPGMCSKAS